MPSPTFPPFPSLPDTQGLSSSTFAKPPLASRTLTLPELYDWHSIHSPRHPSIIYRNTAGDVQTIDWAELSRAVHTAAHFVNDFMQDPGDSKPVIAILAATESITYLTLIIGILRAGYCVFPISPRNSPKAIAHLLEKTHVSYLLIGAEPMFHDLARSAFSLLPERERKYPMIVVRDMPTFDVLFLDPSKWRPFPVRMFQMDDLAIIQHSSGSTAFPKPIYWPHGALLETGTTPYFGEMDLCGLIFGCQAIPMFHGLGTTMAIMAACCGVTLAFFTPSTPAIIPNPENFFADIIGTRTDVACSVPVFLETWSKNKDYVEKLAKMKGILYGGGPLNKAAGDLLASHGVSIYVTYASSEGGVLSAYLTSNPGMDWEYFRFSGHTKPHFIPYDEGIVEVVFEAHSGHHPRIINSHVQGHEVYSSNDLLVRHPSNPALFKVYGRSDDQIMLSTGEKTNPGPLEAILTQDPHVKAAVMFGRGRFQNGVLISPSEEYISASDDERQFSTFCEAIWPSIQELNRFAPSHSRLFKEMIIVSKPCKPFLFTIKGTPRRQAILQDYAEEIDALYTRLASSTEMDIPIPSSSWEPTEARVFVRRVVGSIIKDFGGIGDEVDLFQVGCDSLQAIWIRNSVHQALIKSGNGNAAHALGENAVYQHPTVASLAVHVSCLVSPTQNGISTEEKELSDILNMLAKYNTNFSAHLDKHVEVPEQFTPIRSPTLLSKITAFFSTNRQAQASPYPITNIGVATKRSRRKQPSTTNSHIQVPEQGSYNRRFSYSPAMTSHGPQSISIVAQFPSSPDTPTTKKRGHGKRLSISNLFSPLSNHSRNTPDVVYLEPSLRSPAVTHEKRPGHRKRMSLSTPSPPIHSGLEHHKRRWSLSKVVIPSPDTLTRVLSPLSPLSRPDRDVIVVTGTTGGLGSNILYHLALDPGIKRIYALNRKVEGKSLKERQEDSLKWTEELDEKINVLLFGKIKLMECQFDQPGFGLAPNVLEDIRRDATHIIHNAWRVDFNLALPAFEPQLILVRQLVDLALSSKRSQPPRFLFISSVSACCGPHKVPVQEGVMENPPRTKSGYGQSKWIAEHVLLTAAKDTPLRPTIVRLGQISGDPSGYWNEREWFPSIVKSATVTRCLPHIPGDVSWVSAHTAAKALIEMRNAETPVLHLAHPHPTSWKSIVTPLAQTLSAEIVDYRQWLSVLDNTLMDPSSSTTEHVQRNPALRLLSFFKSLEITEYSEPVGVPRLSVTKATTISPSLASAEPLQPGDVEKWIEAWRKRQFI